MNTSFLSWDSEFFGFTVERMNIENTPIVFADIKNILENSSARLTYIFSPIEFPSEQVKVLNVEKYDEKVTFRKNISPENETIINSATEFSGSLNKELETLAYVSGIYSRFNRDPNLNGFFKPLYYEWMKKSCLDKNGTVLVIYAEDQSSIAGMLTVSCYQRLAKIGLVAVDEKYRGKGYGAALMDACEVWCSRRGAICCDVSTQKMNTPACKLYQKSGYSIIKKEIIYHYWSKNAI